jgi:hypothetical protein
MTPWSKAFARQADSDLRAYEILARSSLPVCHRLHYTQMWLEKLCKVYLWLPDGQAEPRTVHQVIGKILPRVVAQHWRQMNFDGRPNMKEMRELCREIDLLHPQVDDMTRRPDNVEYPWFSRGNVIAPADASFLVAGRLYTPTGRLLMKAATWLTRNPSTFALQK